MNTLIPGTNRTPTVSFQDGTLAISGRSYMENSVEFYAPIKKLVEDLLSALDKKCVSGASCKIKWSYKADDEDMKDSAEEFRDVLRHVPVELEEIDD